MKSYVDLSKNSEYQLVLEFHGDDPDEFKRVLALETQLDKALESGQVDGNDVSQGVAGNFWIKW